MGGVRGYVKDLLFRWLGVYKHLSSEAYVEFARARGCSIGEGTEFFGEKKLDLNRAPLISIGEDCLLTDRVRLLVHTWDTPVLKERFGAEKSPKHFHMGPITVGDNVFIGENTIVLPNVTIGDNTIIGAGSVVSSDIPADSVAVGNPCEVVMSLDEFRQKRLDGEYEMVSEYVSRCEDRGVTPEATFHQYLEEHGR